MRLAKLWLLSVLVASQAGYAEVEPNALGGRLIASDHVGSAPTPSGQSNKHNQAAQFDKRKLLRCWQEGVLIVNESGWQASDSMIDAGKQYIKGEQTMNTYQFGDTFCVYFSE